jgi:O-antigen ligase
MCLAAGRKTIMLPEELRRSAVAWGCFLLVAFASIEKAKDALSSTRATFDGFLLPALLGWCVIRNFDVRRHLIALHAVVCTMVLYIAAIGAVEMLTGTDLLPLQEAGLYFAGPILRPNGPFSSLNSFALIGLISFCFLLFLRRAIDEQLAWWQRVLHAAGLASALAAALMPLFRSVGITLLVILLLDMYFNRRVGRMLAQLAVLTSVIVALAAFSAKLPDAFEDRSHGGNFYSRIAQQRQTFELFKMHPFTGLGIANFENVAEAQGQSVGFYKGFESGDSPHNNLGGILAETGLVGFLPYVASQVLLITAFSKLRRVETRHSRTVWISFLYVFLSYWVSGLSLTSGYYSDLNLWYMFVLMVIYKYAITESKNLALSVDRAARMLR